MATFHSPIRKKKVKTGLHLVEWVKTRLAILSLNDNEDNAVLSSLHRFLHRVKKQTARDTSNACLSSCRQPWENLPAAPTRFPTHITSSWPKWPPFFPVSVCRRPIFDLRFQCGDAYLGLQILHLAPFQVILLENSAFRWPKISLQLAFKEQ